MTLHTTAQHIHSVTAGDFYNREKFSLQWLQHYIRKMTTTIGKPHVFEAALPDGWWYISVTQIAPGEYGYYIPETREQEASLKASLFGK